MPPKFAAPSHVLSQLLSKVSRPNSPCKAQVGLVLLPLAFLHLSFRLADGSGEGKATWTLAQKAHPYPKGDGSAMPSVANLHGEVCILLLLGNFFWENSCLKKLFLCRFFVICVRFCIGLDVRGSKQRQNPKGFFSSSNGCQNFALTCLVSRFFSPRWCDFLINKMVRKLRLFGGTKQCKCMVLVRDFPFIVPCFGLIIHHAPLSRGSMFWWKISVIGPRSFCRLAGRGAADKGPENLRATTLTKRGCWNTTKQWTQGNATPAGAVEKTGIRLGSMVVSAMHSDTNQNFQLKISKMQLKMNLSSEIKKKSVYLMKHYLWNHQIFALRFSNFSLTVLHQAVAVQEESAWDAEKVELQERLQHLQSRLVPDVWREIR